MTGQQPTAGEGTTTGPCARCGVEITRYGDDGRVLCWSCEEKPRDLERRMYVGKFSV